MVSISGVSAGQASTYYTEKDNYYIKETGTWAGKGAESLGLSGAVNKDQFQNILHGKSPDGKEDLVHYTPRMNPETGELQEQRAGVDMTFSAPKSASILGIADQRIQEAHDRAVTVALGRVEDYAQYRNTVNGNTEKINSGNLVIARFNHDTSRELDPQMHTHAVIMNMTQREDGKWRALSNEELFSQKMFIGQVYRNEFAANLKELGYAVRADSRGLFEIKGVNQELIDYFSRRSEQIDAKVAELKAQELYKNAGDSKLREIATLGSRIAKRDGDMTLVRESWVDRIKDHGFSLERIKEDAQQAGINSREAEARRMEPQNNEYDYVRQATKIINEQESNFTKEDVLKTGGKLSIGEQRIASLDKAFVELSKDREIINIGRTVDRQGGKTDWYSTREMGRIERGIIKYVEQTNGNSQPVLTPRSTLRAVRDYEQTRQLQDSSFKLTADQLKAVEHVLESRNMVDGIQGDAGSGKTELLHAIRVVAEREGYRVHGIAFTGKAAAEMQQASGIKSQTIDSFLERQEKSDLNVKQLWTVDEASMLGSNKMSQLFKAADKSVAKVLLIGDTKQLQAIEAGNMFTKLQETKTMNTVRMSENIRQKDSPEYQAMVKAMADKKIDTAFEKMKKRDRIHEIADRGDRLGTIVKDYTARKGYKDNIIVTARNADRTELNHSVRTELQDQGKLAGPEYTFTVRESKNLSPIDKHFAQNYQAGDIVIGNQHHIIGRAGTEAKVISSDQQNHSLRVQSKDGKEYSIDLKTQGQHLSAYIEKQEQFMERDKVVLLKNDRGLAVQNGQTGIIKSIEPDGKVVVGMENGNDLKINVKSQYNYIDHGYAVTAYKSQGQTSQHVLYHADTSKDTTYNEAYVAVSRGKNDVSIYTDNKAELKEQMANEQVKTSTLDRNKEDQSERTTAEPHDKGHGVDHIKTETVHVQGPDYQDRDHGKGHDQDRGIGKEESDKTHEVPEKETDGGKDSCKGEIGD